MPTTSLHQVDEGIISWSARIAPFAQRVSIAIVYVWFGLLKVFGVSPAFGIVAMQLKALFPMVPAVPFVVGLGVFEAFIGGAILVRRLDRLTVALLALHLVAILIPVLVLPNVTWSGPMIPTLEGQYVLKNVLIAAIALTVAAQVRPLSVSSKA